jgi:hypothetical protein
MYVGNSAFAPADGAQTPVTVIEPKTRTKITTIIRRQSTSPLSRSTPHTTASVVNGGDNAGRSSMRRKT